MKAVRVTAPTTLEVADVPEPDGEIIVRSRTVGICGTDVKVFKGAIPVAYPRVMGHEMIGEVVSAPVGSPFGAGDRVLIDPASSCGHCHLCVRGRGHLCLNAGLMGREIDGVFAELVSVPARQLLPVPDSISATAAGLLQVLGTCVHAQKTVNPFPGQTAAVIGLGVAGQLMSQILTQRGVTVVGITRSEWKRDLALRLGAVATAAPDEAVGVLAEVTTGRGPDLVVEAAGTERTLAQSIDLAAIGGEVLVFGTLTGGGEGLPYYQLYFKELTLHNPRAALPGDYADGIELASSGRLDLEPIVTHQLGLDDAEEAFQLVHDPSSLKVLMHVG
ncbi:MAG: alcohol dehydrogenase catalytic domain-containing protein [Acidimicrobiia bacterium]|nr:alcohol dehydrogenase catalytic domain-containing protein [Acidimicrobiia bacterium]MDH4305985.1 alcohol dehydrogenase catalytic domain-containing protein [Acidimicrobiia bacterium]MDH5294220.1 alcohol dehydrogenase catalytic domain-containing protein [Acidimicrobiia bacterium]